MDAHGRDEREVLRGHLSHGDLHRALCWLIDEEIAYERGKRPDNSDVLREIRDTLRQQDRVSAFDKIKLRLTDLHNEAMKELKNG